MQKEQNVVRVCVLLTGLSLKKTPHVWLPHAKLTFYCYGVRFLIARHMACDQREIKYWLENDRVRNDDIESQKNLACFRTYGTDV